MSQATDGGSPETSPHDASLPALSVPLSLALTALGFALTHALVYAAGALIAFRADTPLASGLVAAHADALVHGLALLFGLGTVTLVVSLRARAPGRLHERVGLVATPLASLGWAALLGVSVHVAGAELVNVLRESFPLPAEIMVAQRRLLTPQGFREGVGAVLAFVALAPLTEEVFFRGVVFPGLTRRYGHPWFSLLISALLFGITHVEPVAIFYASLLGAGLALLTLRARSIVPALVAHAAHNALPLLVPERLVRIEGLNTLGEAGYHLHPLVVLAATLSALLAARALHQSLEAPP